MKPTTGVHAHAAWDAARWGLRYARPSARTCMVVVFLLAAGRAYAQPEDLQLAYTDFLAGAGSGDQPGPFTASTNINALLGADRFYDAGITGTNAVMANIEAGYAWNGHETLTHVQEIPKGTSAVLGEADRHATWVTMLMGGRPAGDENTPSPVLGIEPYLEIPRTSRIDLEGRQEHQPVHHE